MVWCLLLWLLKILHGGATSSVEAPEDPSIERGQRRGSPFSSSTSSPSVVGAYLFERLKTKMDQFAAAPSFIRNIVDPGRQLRELIIPKAFVEENLNIFHGRTSVILQAPGGQEYEVSLKRKNDKIVLCGGWKSWNDFAKHYDVDLGYFLVFLLHHPER